MTARRPNKGVLTDPTPWTIERNPIGEEKKIIQGVIQTKLEALLDHYGIDGMLADAEISVAVAAALSGRITDLLRERVATFSLSAEALVAEAMEIGK